MKKDASSPALEPTMENVLSSSYPISRNLFWYVVGEPSGDTEAGRLGLELGRTGNCQRGRIPSAAKASARVESSGGEESSPLPRRTRATDR
jgi:hypothetical protein